MSPEPNDFQSLIGTGAGAGLASAVSKSLFLTGHRTSGVTNTHGNLLKKQKARTHIPFVCVPGCFVLPCGVFLVKVRAKHPVKYVACIDWQPGCGKKYRLRDNYGNKVTLKTKKPAHHILHVMNRQCRPQAGTLCEECPLKGHQLLKRRLVVFI